LTQRNACAVVACCNRSRENAMQRHPGPHFDALRDALERRHAELIREVEAAELARRAPIDRTEVGDREDAAVRFQAGDIGEAEEGRDVVELRQVEAALHRIAVGRYGGCVECGMPISLARLCVQPAAQRCAACQAERERSARHLA
jgi:RNA polymerase-binding transcription factor